MSRFAYEFVGKVAALTLGPWTYSVVYLPKEVAAELPLQENPRLRVRGEIGEFAFSGAWQPTGGKWYLKLSKEFLKKAECGVGDWVNVRFNIDDQAAVDLPEGLRLAIEGDAEFQAGWEKLTPGKQRSWALPVAQAKGAATIQKRVAELRATLLKAGLG